MCKCGKIGIDCEWCECKSKCIPKSSSIKQFYKDEINKTILFEQSKNKIYKMIDEDCQLIYKTIDSQSNYQVIEYYGNKVISFGITVNNYNSDICYWLGISPYDEIRKRIQEKYDFSYVDIVGVKIAQLDINKKSIIILVEP